MRLPLIVPADHPALAGHFPTRPIVPGVVLLDLAMRAIAAHIGLEDAAREGVECEIANAKFLSPVAPGESLVVDFEAARPAPGATATTRCTVRILVGASAGAPEIRVAATAAWVWRARDGHDHRVVPLQSG